MSFGPMMKPSSAEERFALVRSVGEECINESDLKNLIEKKPIIRCYDGFEPSGRMHIAQGIFKAINVNKCTASGCHFVFWVADWFALMNDKMGGELEKIKTVGKYLVEVWKAAGMDMENVTFLWSSEEINNNASEYWKIVIDIARRNTLARIKKCCTIMGKQEGTLTAAQILYPLMQCADVFFLKADVCQLGLDQRKVNMLAREYCDQIGRKLKPVILSHHMLSGLKAGQAKMSKSDPDSAIFMEDTAEDVERKILAAHCPRTIQKTQEITDDGAPTGSDETNPCLDYVRCIIFSVPGATFSVGNTVYTTCEDVERAFVDGVFTEEELKRALISVMNALLDPVRSHFAASAEAGALLDTIKAYKKQPAAEATPEAPPAAKSPKMVFWMPASTRLHLDTVMSAATALNNFVSVEGQEAVVILPDWSAAARNEVTGEEKDITAVMSLNAALFKAFGLNDKVSVLRQSEMILQNPNDYWVSAINVGRKHLLSRIEVAAGEVPTAGVVVGSLMRVADAVATRATVLLTVPESDVQQNSFACEHIGGATSEVALPAAPFRKLCDPASAATTEDAFLFIDDSELDVRRKIKKAFAAEKDAQNPVVWLTEALMGDGVTIKSPSGDLTLTAASDLAEGYNAGTIHPGDLKAALVERLLQFTSVIRSATSTPDVKKLTTAVRNAEKKLKKK